MTYYAVIRSDDASSVYAEGSFDMMDYNKFALQFKGSPVDTVFASLDFNYLGITINLLDETVYFFRDLEYITLFKLNYSEYILRENSQKPIFS